MLFLVDMVSQGSDESLTLLMELADELFNLGDAALEDQISIIRLALGGLAGDEGQHQVFNFIEVGCLTQSPGQLDIGHFREYFLGRGISGVRIQF
jgi:hypothetical protein